MHSLRIDFTAQHRNPLEHVGMYINEDDEQPHYLEAPFAPGTFVTRQVGGREDDLQPRQAAQA